VCFLLIAERIEATNELTHLQDRLLPPAVPTERTPLRRTSQPDPERNMSIDATTPAATPLLSVWTRTTSDGTWRCTLKRLFLEITQTQTVSFWSKSIAFKVIFHYFYFFYFVFLFYSASVGYVFDAHVHFLAHSLAHPPRHLLFRLSRLFSCP